MSSGKSAPRERQTNDRKRPGRREAPEPRRRPFQAGQKQSEARQGKARQGKSNQGRPKQARCKNIAELNQKQRETHKNQLKIKSRQRQTQKN
jgi:hypothetical protein